MRECGEKGVGGGRVTGARLLNLLNRLNSTVASPV